MRESFSGTWTMQIVIVFILFFVSFITLTINYTRAFRVKNEVISIIEREEGFTASYGDAGTISATAANDPAGARELIAMYLYNNGYNVKGTCPVGWVGVKSITPSDYANHYNDTFEEVTNSNKKNKYYYCVQKVHVPIKKRNVTSDYNYQGRSYYKVRLFFKFSIPIFGELTTFKVEGESIEIYFNGDGLTPQDASVDGGGSVVYDDGNNNNKDTTNPTPPTSLKLMNPSINLESATYALKIGGSTDDSNSVTYFAYINNNWVNCGSNGECIGALAGKDSSYTIYAKACDPSGNCSPNSSLRINMNPKHLYVWQLYQYIRSYDGSTQIAQPSELEIMSNLANEKMAQNVYNMYNSNEANAFFRNQESIQSVKNLYRGILGRNFDDAGMRSNVNVYESSLDGKNEALKVFINSVEAQKLYDKWGLGTGTI